MFFIAISGEFTLNFQLNLLKRLEAQLFTRRSVHFLPFKRPGNRNFNYLGKLCKAFSGENESLFCDVSTNICKTSSLNFPIFFRGKTFFPEIILKDPGKEAVQIFMNKKIYIFANGKIT